MQVIVHYMVRNCLVPFDYVLVYGYHENVLADIVDVDFVIEFVQQKQIDVLVTFTIRIRVLTSRQ